MPAYVGSPETLGAKLVTVYQSNAAQGLPTHLATIVLLEPGTGALQAVLDGRYITEARTAAVSAASARHLARQDARVLAIIGSGVQAQSHIEALQRVRDFAEIRIWSPTRAHVEKLIEDMQPHSTAPMKVCDVGRRRGAQRRRRLPRHRGQRTGPAPRGCRGRRASLRGRIVQAASA